MKSFWENMRLSDLAQLILDASDSGIKLYDWQRKWIDDESRFRVMLKSRAVGGSFLIALESFLWSLLKPNSLTLLMSYSQDQSLELFRKVREHIERWSGIRIKAFGETYTLTINKMLKTEIEFGNGSRIISLPNNPDRARGYRADFFYLDEAAMFRDDFALRSAIMPTLIGKGGRLSMISTPKGKRGWFWEAYQAGEKKEKWSLHKVHYTQAPHITKEDIEAMKAGMPPLEWEQEMELKFLDELNALFPYDLILSCTIQDEPYPYIVPGKTKTENPIYVGIDFGRYRDSTVIIALEKLEDETMRVVFIKEFLGESMVYQREYISKLIDALSPIQVLIDKTGLGIPMYDFLSQQYPNVEGVTFTATRKEAMILNLYNYMKARRLIMPADCEELIWQLRQFQRIQTPSGSVKYEAPPNTHDDYVIALALAVYAATQFREGIEVEEVWKW